MFKSNLLLCSAFFLTAMCLPACSGSSDGNIEPSTGGTTIPRKVAPANFTLSCEATLQPRKIDYVVSGDSLTMTVAGQSISIERIGAGAGSKAIYGTWNLPIVTGGSETVTKEHGIKVTASLVIEEGRATAITECSSNYAKIRASVSSPATITDTTFETLEFHTESREWASASGEKIVRAQSFDFGLGAPAETESASEPTLKLGATFPWF